MKKNRNKFPEYLNPKYFNDYQKINVGKSLAKTIFFIIIVAFIFFFAFIMALTYSRFTFT